MPIGLPALELARRARSQGRLAALAGTETVREMHEELEHLYQTQLVAKLAQDRLGALLQPDDG